METKDAWNRIEELKKHPGLAGTPGYEIEIDELREKVDPVYWFFLLMEQPQFVDLNLKAFYLGRELAQNA